MHALPSQGHSALCEFSLESDVLSYCWPAQLEEPPLHCEVNKAYFTYLGMSLFIVYFWYFEVPFTFEGQLCWMWFSCLPGFFFFSSLSTLNRPSPAPPPPRPQHTHFCPWRFFLEKYTRSFRKALINVEIVSFATFKILLHFWHFDPNVHCYETQFLLEFVVFLCLGIYSLFRFGKLLVVISSNEFSFLSLPSITR